MSDEQDKTRTELERDEKGRLLPGQQSLNPAGRPQGTYSLKTKIIKLLQEEPEIEKDVIDGLLKNEKALLLQMIDGRPQQDITSGGERIIPSPIYGGQSAIPIPGYNGDPKDIQTPKENPSGSGGN